MNCFIITSLIVVFLIAYKAISSSNTTGNFLIATAEFFFLIFLKTILKGSLIHLELNTKSSKYISIEKGKPNSKDYSVYFADRNGNAISPFHDIPLRADETTDIYNMVVEIPRWTTAKMEMSRTEALNPIKQDVKHGRLRYVANCFPYHGYIWNYGAFPQTWEYPGHIDSSTGCKGDNDPIDVIEIGSRVAERAEILRVKILGIIGLIDEGETDWKIVTIDINDPKAEQVNDIGDVENAFPGLLRATFEWFKIYKIPDGKPANKFAFNDNANNASFATEIVNETHKFWRTLIENKITSDEISTKNTFVVDSPFRISQENANQVLAAASNKREAEVEPVPDSVDFWHYVTNKDFN